MRKRLLTVEELAAIAHLPYDEIVPALPRAGARQVAPPAGTAVSGRSYPLGTAATDGRPVKLSVPDARYHLHVVGPTGVGKSTFLLHQALAAIRDKRGLVVIDPKGDLVTDILDRLDPDEVGDRVMLIDPAAPSPRWGLDPLAGDDHDLTAENLVSICKRIWERHWGPRADDILKSALLTLLRNDARSLLHLPSLLSKKEYRAPYVAGIDEPWSLSPFWEWFDAMPEGQRAQAIGPVLSRVRGFLTRAFVRETIGAPAHPVNLSRVLNTGGVVLARLPKGLLNEDTVQMLGSILVAKVWQAAAARSGRPDNKRRDAVVILDEAHNFLNLAQSVDSILTEARGYRLSMILAHQYLGQLPDDLAKGISANARNKVFFTLSPEDAHTLSKHTESIFSQSDLARLPAYQAACRIVAGGGELSAFSLATAPPPERLGRTEEIRRLATPRDPL